MGFIRDYAGLVGNLTFPCQAAKAAPLGVYLEGEPLRSMVARAGPRKAERASVAAHQRSFKRGESKSAYCHPVKFLGIGDDFFRLSAPVWRAPDENVAFKIPVFPAIEQDDPLRGDGAREAAFSIVRLSQCVLLADS